MYGLNNIQNIQQITSAVSIEQFIGLMEKFDHRTGLDFIFYK